MATFRFPPSGQLVTAEGDPVMGEQGVIPVVGGPLSVSDDGTISVNGAVAGKLKLVDLAPDANLQTVGKTYYTASPNYETPASERVSSRECWRAPMSTRSPASSI